MISVEDRFFAKVEWGEKFNGVRCLLWTAGTNGNGYATFWDGTRKTYAYRWLYERWVGPVPDDMEIDHLCRVRHCVNPMHLEAVTHRENLLRGNTIASHFAAKTHCPRGHAYDEENTYLRPDGRGRDCLTCMRYTRRAERKAAANA